MTFTQLILIAYVIGFIVLFLYNIVKPHEEMPETEAWVTALVGAGYLCIPLAFILAIIFI